MDDELENAEPILIEMVPCEGRESIKWMSGPPTCGVCSQQVRFEEQIIDTYVCPACPTGKREALINLPHDRPMTTYLIDDVTGCSCGGLHGELGDIKKVSCLREKLSSSFSAETAEALKTRIRQLEAENKELVQTLEALTSREKVRRDWRSVGW